MQLSTQVPYAIKLQEMCSHEEADTRVFVHLKHAVGVGYRGGKKGSTSQNQLGPTYIM